MDRGVETGGGGTVKGPQKRPTGSILAISRKRECSGRVHGACLNGTEVASHPALLDGNYRS